MNVDGTDVYDAGAPEGLARAANGKRQRQPTVTRGVVVLPRPTPAHVVPGERWCDCGAVALGAPRRCPACGSTSLIDPTEILRPEEYRVRIRDGPRVFTRGPSAFGGLTDS